MSALANLPFNGLLQQPEALGGLKQRLRTYICTGETPGPGPQIVSTDQSTAAWVRVLKKKEQSINSSRKIPASSDAKAKRPLENKPDEGPSKKLSLFASPPAATLQPRGFGAINRPTGQGLQAANITSGREALEQSAGAAQPQGPRRTFTFEELKVKSNKDLQELLKSRGLPVTGKKEELLRRLMDYQRRMKRAQQPS